VNPDILRFHVISRNMHECDLFPYLFREIAVLKQRTDLIGSDIVTDVTGTTSCITDYI
jgi:hypothetical protein